MDVPFRFLPLSVSAIKRSKFCEIKQNMILLQVGDKWAEIAELDTATGAVRILAKPDDRETQADPFHGFLVNERGTRNLFTQIRGAYFFRSTIVAGM